MTDYRTLLAEYVKNDSEVAFRELVAGYTDLVYATALHLLNGDTHRAQDVAQIVFTDLARLARTLPAEVLLGGWLHRRTWHVATTLLRDDRRRWKREKQACEMNMPDNDSELDFDRVAPFLDEAINQLSVRDRAAIVMRFFERRDLRAVGQALGSNEDAAQKCVSRAVEKLRTHFLRRGVSISAGLLVGALGAHVAQAAPAGLAATFASASLAGRASASSFSLIDTIKMLLMKKTTYAILTAAIVGGVSIPMIGAKADPTNAPVTAQSLSKGLVLHLNFDQEETSGHKVLDSSGKSNHGKASGAHWTAEGKNGGAYEFKADGDQIEIPNNPSLNPKQITLAAWIKTTTGDHYWRRVFDKGYNRAYALSVAGDNRRGYKFYGKVSSEMGPGEHPMVTKKTVNDGQWHQVVTTFDGALQALYVDGQLDGRPVRWKKGEQLGVSDFNLVIGCNRSNIDKKEDDLGVSFRGVIDEPMMWNRALSTNEIAFLFESQK